MCDKILFVLVMCLAAISHAALTENTVTNTAIIKHDFPLQGKCEKFLQLAENCSKEIDSKGLKTGAVWLEDSLTCSLRILFVEVKTSPSGAFENYIKEKQDALFENEKIHIYRVQNLIATIRLSAGLSDKSGNYEVMHTERVIPMISTNLWDFSTFIFKVLGKQYMDIIETDPAPFLAYLTKEISAEYANEFKERVLKFSNRIEVATYPYLVIDNGELISVPWGRVGHATNCKQGWPSCRFSK